MKRARKGGLEGRKEERKEKEREVKKVKGNSKVGGREEKGNWKERQ